MKFQGGGDALRDLVLDRKDVFDATVIALRPEMDPGRDAYVQDGEPQLNTRDIDAVFENRDDAKVVGNLAADMPSDLEPL